MRSRGLGLAAAFRILARPATLHTCKQLVVEILRWSPGPPRSLGGCTRQAPSITFDIVCLRSGRAAKPPAPPGTLGGCVWRKAG
eukprot:5724654-Alexandrium_andersonii.AAC.1